MPNKVFCGLCGNEIIPPKGTRSTALSREQQQGAHDSCIKQRQELVNKHRVHPNIEFTTKIEALIEIHPELEETKTMKKYRKREKTMNKELEELFPYLRGKAEEKRKKAEEKKKKAGEKEELNVGGG